MEKCGRAEYAADDNMAHAHYMQDNHDYRHTLRIVIAFPLQQWLHERALLLRYTYIVLFPFRYRHVLCIA